VTPKQPHPDDLYGPWPAPKGYPDYSTYVVWKATVVETMRQWVAARKGRA
jgi:hypothetical protein